PSLAAVLFHVFGSVQVWQKKLGESKINSSHAKGHIFYGQTQRKIALSHKHIAVVVLVVKPGKTRSQAEVALQQPLALDSCWSPPKHAIEQYFSALKWTTGSRSSLSL